MTPPSSPSPRPSTAIVTVTYNSLVHFEAFLKSARRELGDGGEIVVVDNGSQDLGALRRVVEAYDARLVAAASNLGYGSAVNIGAGGLAPSTEYILISNPDVVLHPGSLESLHREIALHPDAGAVGPQVLNKDGSVYPSARSLPSLRTGVGHALLGQIAPRNRWTRAYHSDASAEMQATETGWLSGSCLMVRRDAFEQIGGFDPDFFMYFEDVDLGYRLKRWGWKSYYVPAARVTHEGGHSTRENSAAMIRAHHESAYRYIRRRYTGWALAPLRLVLRAGLALRSYWLIRRAP